MHPDQDHSASAATNCTPAVILCVDDEPSILSALRRLFRPAGYQVLLAQSAAAALELLQQQAVDLVISDMRMPEMDGAQFLHQVRQRWPQPMRLLLTGYADISAIVEAVNQGEIYRYITKPWDDGELLQIVREALQHGGLQREQQRLLSLLAQQNTALRLTHVRLEDLVIQRSTELTAANESLRHANERLKARFITSIKVFSSLVELRSGHLAGHARRVADLSRRLALKLGQDAKLAQEIMVAALLHNIGKVGLSDELLMTPPAHMSTSQLARYQTHPARAKQLLMPLPDLQNAATMIGAQLECFDGSGVPRQLCADEIPLGARIIAIASDYDTLQTSAAASQGPHTHSAHTQLLQSSGKRHDPALVQTLLALVDSATGASPSTDAAEPVLEQALRSGQLQVGMVLSRDLITPSGMQMLCADHVLDQPMIQKIIDFEKAASLRLTLHVYPQTDVPGCG